MGKNVKILPILFLAIVSAYSCGNSHHRKNSAMAPGTDTAIISFSEYEHDFGKITQGEKVSCSFTFENKGKGPLVISSVTTSCGCTVPKYEKKPVLQGGTGTIEVVFDSSGKEGRQTKSVTIESNASKPVVLLRITGEVVTATNN